MSHESPKTVEQMAEQYAWGLPYDSIVKRSAYYAWVEGHRSRDAAFATIEQHYGQACIDKGRLQDELTARDAEVATLQGKVSDLMTAQSQALEREAEVAALRARVGVLERDALCWQAYKKNPYAATDKILASLNVNSPRDWADQATAALSQPHAPEGQER